jgi:hypothetical protein
MVSFPDLPSFPSPIQIAVPHITGTQDILWVRALRVIRRVLTASAHHRDGVVDFPEHLFPPLLLSLDGFRGKGEGREMLPLGSQEVVPH